MVKKPYNTDIDQHYAPAVCAVCGDRLGWVGVNEALKDYTFELHGVHPDCPGENKKEKEEK